MTDFSSKSCCVVENSSVFQSWAHRLSRDFGRVYYHRTGRRPSASDREPGMGYQDIELVEHWEDLLNKVDLWAFVDVYDGALQEHLVSLGKRVFGARRGDELEIWRADFRRIMRDLSLPTQDYKKVTGIRALSDALKNVDDKWIKTGSNIRGTTETWHHKSWALSQAHLDFLSSKLGALKDSQVFLIDTPIEDVEEYGYDDMAIDGEQAPHGMVGVEDKDKSYFGCFMRYEDIPEPLQETNEALGGVLAKYKYRGMYSIELRGDILIDPCCRAPSPAGECEQEVYANLAERMWHGAKGEVVDPIPVATWAAQAGLSSDHIEKDPMPITIPEDRRQWVKLYNSAKGKDGQEWITPYMEMHEVGTIVGIGDTADEAVTNLEKNSEGFSEWAMELRCEIDSVAKARESLQRVLRGNGIRVDQDEDLVTSAFGQ